MWEGAQELAKTACQTLKIDQTDLSADGPPYKPQPSEGEDDSTEEEDEAV